MVFRHNPRAPGHAVAYRPQGGSPSAQWYHPAMREEAQSASYVRDSTHSSPYKDSTVSRPSYRNDSQPSPAHLKENMPPGKRTPAAGGASLAGGGASLAGGAHLKENTAPGTHNARTLASYGRTTSYGADFVYSGSSKHAPRACLPAFGDWAASAAGEEETSGAGGGMKTYSKQFSDLQRERYKKKRELRERKEHHANLAPHASPSLPAGHVALETPVGPAPKPESPMPAGTSPHTRKERSSLASLFGFRKPKTAGTGRLPNPQEASRKAPGASEGRTPSSSNHPSRAQHPQEERVLTSQGQSQGQSQGHSQGQSQGQSKGQSQGQSQGHVQAPWRNPGPRDPSLTAAGDFPGFTSGIPEEYPGEYPRGGADGVPLHTGGHGGAFEGGFEGGHEGGYERGYEGRYEEEYEGGYEGEYEGGYGDPAGAVHSEGFAFATGDPLMDPPDVAGVPGAYQEVYPSVGGPPGEYQEVAPEVYRRGVPGAPYQAGVPEVYGRGVPGVYQGRAPGGAKKIPPFQGPAGLWQRTFSVSSHVPVSAAAAAAPPLLHSPLHAGREACSCSESSRAALVWGESGRGTAGVGCCSGGAPKRSLNASGERLVYYTESEMSRKCRKKSGLCGRVFGWLFGCFSP